MISAQRVDGHHDHVQRTQRRIAALRPLAGRQSDQGQRACANRDATRPPGRRRRAEWYRRTPGETQTQHTKAYKTKMSPDLRGQGSVKPASDAESLECKPQG